MSVDLLRDLKTYLRIRPTNSVVIRPLSASTWPCRLFLQPKLYVDQFQIEEKEPLEMVLIIKESWKGAGSCAESLRSAAVNRFFVVGWEAKVIANPIRIGEILLD